MKLRAVTAAALIGFAAAALAPQPAVAQSAVSPQVRNAIDDAARTGDVPNPWLAAVVMQAIAANPSSLEAVVAAAVDAQPATRRYVVERAAGTFPGWAGRIRAAAGGDGTPSSPSRAHNGSPIQIAQSSGPPAVGAGDAPEIGPIAQSATASRRFFRNVYADVGGGASMVLESDLDDPALGNREGTLSSDVGYLATGAVGFELGRDFRVEAEVGYRRNDLDEITIGGFGFSSSQAISGTTSVLSGMVNGWYDIPGYGGVIPYLGGGAGIASISVEIDDNKFDESDLVFAYQFGAGIRIPVSQSILLRLGYRFFATTAPELGTTEAEYYAHAGEAGVAFQF